MADVFKCVGKAKVDFPGSDGKQVSGIHLYVVAESPYVEGYKTDRFFISAYSAQNLDYIPNVNDEFEVLYNRYGKPGEFIKL